MKTLTQEIKYIIVIVCMIAFGACKQEEDEKPLIEYGNVTDHQGNQYVTVKIGEQWWMAENLRTTTFPDGTAIAYISAADSNSTWADTSEPTYTALNSGANGILYNGYVVIAPQSIAPNGWHIATDSDWKKLESTAGISSSELSQTGWRGDEAAAALTSQYSQGWPSDIPLFGTDEYGFNALPTGCRIADGRTNIFNNTAFWWTSTLVNDQLTYRYVDGNYQGIFRQYENLHYGMSIRCVKD